MSITSRLLLLSLIVSLATGAMPGSQKPAGASIAPPIDRLIEWLDDPSTAWIATAWLQQIGEPALPALLAAGATLTGPHGRISPRMLALAKIGEPAIPAIAERLSEIQRQPDRSSGEGLALLQVLGNIGPPAIPALVEAELSATRGFGAIALDEIIAMEGNELFGELPNPWLSWRPQDDRTGQIAGYITPLLPRIREFMERESRSWRPQALATHRPAAYLLARWGAGPERARGIELLEELSRADEPFHRSLESARLLYRLRAPGISSLLRQIAARIPRTDDLNDQSRLQIGIALFDIGDTSYVDLIETALRGSNLYARQKAIDFARRAGDLRLVPALIDRLADNTETSTESIDTIKGRIVRTRETIADAATAALQALTFQSIGRDSLRWRQWWNQHSISSHRKLLSDFVGRLALRIRAIPIWEANRRIEQLSATTVVPIAEVLAEYLDRLDLDASAVGPNLHRGGGGPGPIGANGPWVVTLLLRLEQLGQDEARSLLERAMRSADPDVQHYAALSVGSYDRRSALDFLARELDGPDPAFRPQVADLLLAFDDARGIPVLIDQLSSDHEVTRHMTCRDLRIYTQQPLPCDSTLPSSERAANIERWRSWWKAVPTFQAKGRQAALDLQAGPEVTPVSFRQGLRVAQIGNNH